MLSSIQRLCVVLAIVALAHDPVHGDTSSSRCLVRFLDGCAADPHLVELEDDFGAEYDAAVASLSASEEHRCLARSKEYFNQCVNQQHQQVMATYTPSGAATVFPADEAVEEAIKLLDSPGRDTSAAADVPLLLFPQCKVDGFWSTHGQISNYVYVARLLLKAGVDFQFVVPDLYFWEQPKGKHSVISKAAFEKVFDIEHLERFLGAKVLSHGALLADMPENRRGFKRAFFITTKLQEGQQAFGRRDLFFRCADAFKRGDLLDDGLQGVSTILAEAQTIYLSFNESAFIAELAEILTRNTHPRALFIVHGVPESIVRADHNQPFARGSRLALCSWIAASALPISSGQPLKLSAAVCTAAAFVRSLWNISAQDSWIHLHVRRGNTYNLPGVTASQMTDAEIDFAVERAMYNEPGCLSTLETEHKTLVMSSIDALGDAIMLQTLHPRLHVRLFEHVLWDVLAAQGIAGWTGEQILRDLVEVQMMRDAGVFIGSKSRMSEVQLEWRARERGCNKACNIHGQPCLNRLDDYHRREGTQRLGCLET